MGEEFSAIKKEITRKIDFGEIQRIIGQNIGIIRTKQKMSQKKLGSLCGEYGYPLSQSMISNIEKAGTTNLFHLIAIARSLDVDLAEIVCVKDMNIEVKVADNLGDNNVFLTNPKNSEFESYFGRFMTFFYKTNNSSNQALITGNLSIKASEDSEHCEWILCLENGESYEGKMFISRKAQSAYSLLVNEKEGDACFIIFSHAYKKMSAWFADVVTVSAMTNNKRPTTHRMCITRKSSMTELEMKYIKAHLLQNDNKILLKDNVLHELIKNEALPNFVRENLEQVCRQSQYKCYNVPEELIVSMDVPNTERLEYLTYIRSFSVSAKYNKIAREVDQFINDFLENPITCLDQ